MQVALIFQRTLMLIVKFWTIKKFDSREEFDEEINFYLQKLNPDYVILAGYMRILSKVIFKGI